MRSDPRNMDLGERAVRFGSRWNDPRLSEGEPLVFVWDAERWMWWWSYIVLPRMTLNG